MNSVRWRAVIDRTATARVQRLGRSGPGAEIVNCMLASGTLIVGGTLRHTILFPNVRVEEGAVVENSLLFQGVTVGEGAQLQGIAGHRFQLANDLF